MASLGASASIFQLAFGVNAVAAASELYFRNTHRDIAGRLFVELRPKESTISGAQSERAFEEFVLRSSRGLRIARRAYPALMMLGLAAILLSFTSLVFSAIYPEMAIPDLALWIFSAVTVLILPTGYWLYGRFLRWFERRFTIEALRDGEQRAVYWKAFETFLFLDAQKREMKEVLVHANDALFNLYWFNFLSRLRRWRGALQFWRK